MDQSEGHLESSPEPELASIMPDDKEQEDDFFESRIQISSSPEESPEEGAAPIRLETSSLVLQESSVDEEDPLQNRPKASTSAADTQREEKDPIHTRMKASPLPEEDPFLNLECRPEDSILLVLLGKSRSGKASTINNLFADPKLVGYTATIKTGSPLRPAVPTSIRLSRKPLYIPRNDEGELSKNKNLVIANIDLLKDVALAENFFKTHPIFDTPDVIVPHLVILVFNAADPSSYNQLSEYVDPLRQLNIIDRNLLVVVTHAERLGDTKEDFKVNSSRLRIKLKTEIEKHFSSFTDINYSLHVVFVENCPKRLGRSGDFHVLPNGELTPANLLMAMKDVLQDTDDSSLASLFLQWYFKPSCPDRKLISTTEYITIQRLRRPAIPRNSRRKNKLSSAQEDFLNVSNQINSKIGYGFCTATRMFKCALTPEDCSDTLKLKEKVYVFPKGSKLEKTAPPVSGSAWYFLDNSWMSCDNSLTDWVLRPRGLPRNVAEIEEMMHSPATSIKNLGSVPTHNYLEGKGYLLFQESKFILDDPYEAFFKRNFRRYIRGGLPKTYDTNSPKCHVFHQFFTRFGTHVIQAVPIGGALALNLKVDKKYFTSVILDDIKPNAQQLLRCITGDSTADPNVLAAESMRLQEFLPFRIIEGTLESFGGDSEILSEFKTPNSFEDLTIRNLQAFKDSIEFSPEVITFPDYLELLPHSFFLLDTVTQSALEAAIEAFENGELTCTTGLQNSREAIVSEKLPVCIVPEKPGPLPSTSSSALNPPIIPADIDEPPPIEVLSDTIPGIPSLMIRPSDSSFRPPSRPTGRLSNTLGFLRQSCTCCTIS